MKYPLYTDNVGHKYILLKKQKRGYKTYCLFKRVYKILWLYIPSKEPAVWVDTTEKKRRRFR